MEITKYSAEKQEDGFYWIWMDTSGSGATIAEGVGSEVHANLIAEALTVANETGLTPRQLLEQRDELLETCKLGVKFIGSLPRTISQTQQENKDGFLEILEQAINKAQGL